ncbi:Sorting nexin-25 [Amphibalanus amphitrite]|uniref:Sorting nexin-25 n=1 Tax=Amphibalanus amphitrite TaxID=1232801 RepID=A0A6A4WRE9_AMPAM|nr:Sorting nexin-25 [Amphibalanus amphitrite]
MNKSTLKKRLKEWDDKQWKEELEAKSSIMVYRSAKTAIKEDPIYDNTASSIILFQARSNTLPLETRKRHTGEETTCLLCGDGEEDQHHFLLECTKLAEERLKMTSLQRPHQEDQLEVLKTFLFNESTEEMEKNKEGLYKLWRLRKRKLVTVTDGSALDWWPRLLFSLACLLTVVVGAILAVWVHIKLGQPQKVTIKRPVPVDHVKNALKCGSQQDKTSGYQRPPIVSRAVDEVLAEIVSHVVDDFFSSWYSQLAFEPDLQAQAIKNEIWESLRRLQDRLNAIDHVNFIATDVFNKIKQHFQRIRIAHEMSDGKTTLPMYTLVSYLANPERELQFLRSVAEVVIMILLPPDYSRCVPVRQLLRETLACHVFQPAIDLLCDPDFINQKVYEYVHHHQLWRELHQRTYTYAASYEDFIGIIQESNDVDELKHIRLFLATRSCHADHSRRQRKTI